MREILKKQLSNAEEAGRRMAKRLFEVEKERDALAAKLKELEEQEPVAINWPEYHYGGMGCGLEDRGITDRYEAMRHGWDCALDRAAEAIPDRIYAHPVPAEPVRLTEEDRQQIWNVASGHLPGWERHLKYAADLEAAVLRKNGFKVEG